MAAMLMLLSSQAEPARSDIPAEDWIAAAKAPAAVARRCPDSGSADADIVVCGRRDDEKYRLPIRENGFNPRGEAASVSRERNALFQEGDGGIGSCSTVGPGGWTGCGAREFKRRLEQEAK